MQTDRITAPPIATPVADAARRLGIGKTKLYELIASGEIRTVKIGTKTLIPEDDLQKVIRSRLEAAA